MILFETFFFIFVFSVIVSIGALIYFKLFLYLLLEIALLSGFFIWSHYREKKRRREAPTYADWHDEQMELGLGRWDHIGYGSKEDK